MYLQEVIAGTWYDASKTVVHVHVHRYTLYMDMKGGMYLKKVINI